MSTKTGKPDKGVGIKARRDMLLKLLPIHDFKIEPAAREAGYSPKYARSSLHTILKNDKWFCQQVERLKAENVGLAEDKAMALDRKLDRILDDETIPLNQKLKALELRYRRLGLLKDIHVNETDERQRELSTVAKAEARKLAKLALAVKDGDIEQTIKLMRYQAKPKETG